MKQQNNRRSFLKKMAVGGIGTAIFPSNIISANESSKSKDAPDDFQEGKLKSNDAKRKFNTSYQGEYLNRVAFPIGGIGAGMFCFEGTGAISHLSIPNKPEIYNEPALQRLMFMEGVAEK